MTEPIRLILIVAVSFFGGLIQRVTGFGYGIFVMLFFPYLIDMHTRAAAVSTFASGIISAYNAFAYRKHIPYKKLIPLVIGGLVMIPIAVGFSKMISGDFFSKLLGAVLIALSVYFLFFNNRIHLKPTTVNALIAGGTGGLLSGLFSTGGPPIVLYLMNVCSDNNVYFASTQFYFALTGAYSTAVRLFNGIVDVNVLLYTAIAVVGCIAGNYSGKFVFDRLDANKLKRLIYVVMIISGIIMLV